MYLEGVGMCLRCIMNTPNGSVVIIGAYTDLRDTPWRPQTEQRTPDFVIKQMQWILGFLFINALINRLNAWNNSSLSKKYQKSLKIGRKRPNCVLELALYVAWLHVWVTQEACEGVYNAIHDIVFASLITLCIYSNNAFMKFKNGRDLKCNGHITVT